MNWNHSHCLHVGRVMLSSSQSAIDVAYASLSACVALCPLCPLPGLSMFYLHGSAWTWCLQKAIHSIFTCLSLSFIPPDTYPSWHLLKCVFYTQWLWTERGFDFTHQCVLDSSIVSCIEHATLHITEWAWTSAAACKAGWLPSPRVWGEQQ